MVRAAQDKLGRDKVGAVVEDALGQIAIAARDTGTRRFVVAGGETAGAVTQALGVTRLDIGPEIAPACRGVQPAVAGMKWHWH